MSEYYRLRELEIGDIVLVEKPITRRMEIVVIAKQDASLTRVSQNTRVFGHKTILNFWVSSNKRVKLLKRGWKYNKEADEKKQFEELFI